MNNKVLLEIKGLSKSFPGVEALTNVDFNVFSNEIHGLMGENGAGKSTLIKVLTGVYKKDKGTVFFDGKEFESHSPVETPLHGISTVYQEINLIPSMSVAENIYLGREPLVMGNINWREINTRADSVLQRLHINIDVTRELSSYSIAIQQMVAIARALDIKAKILILDEPTSSLDASEVKQLFSVMSKLRSEGMGIIFITHFIDQVYEITDRITVLRNGRLVGVFETGKIPRVQLIAHMLGKELAEFECREKDEACKTEDTTAEEKVFYKIRNMERGDIPPFDMDIKRGEVLGLAGLLGSGRTEIAKLLFGIDKPKNAETWLNIQKDGSIIHLTNVKVTSPKKAINFSFAFCPEDRRGEGIIPDLTVRENIILAIQARKGLFRKLTKREQDGIVEKYIKELNIITPSPDQRVQYLSGGNQQKVILARWLASHPQFLILDEPTRGIDVGVKADIQRLVISLSRQGMAVLFISSELEEVVRCCDRVIVLHEKKIITELTGEKITDDTIMHEIAEAGDVQ
jgi:galactofuranose transport system ATP-binding protein